MALLGLIRIALLSRYPSTHALLGHWFNHANYFTLFLLGAPLAMRREFWARLGALRWTGLASALVCWAMLMIYYALPDAMLSEPAQATFWRDAQRLVHALGEWSAIVAACGFAHRHLDRVPVLRPVFGLGKPDSAQPRLQLAVPTDMRAPPTQKQ